jgi:uncharacterized protein YkwD
MERMAASARDVPHVLAIACAIAGCYHGPVGSGGTDGSSSEGSSGPTTTITQTSDDSITMTSTSASSDPATSNPSDPSASDPSTTDPSDTTAADTSTGEPDETAQICMRWNADRADLGEGAWSGSVASCDPGDIPQAARDNALRVANLYRWLADLPPITTDDTRNAKAQACALMMTANDQLSHTPPADWTCYSGDGAESAGSSNIASTPAVFAVDLYMVDPGNPTTLGHRRWLLSNTIGPTGIGSTDTYSCMWTLGGSGAANADWIAWPPPGPFPYAASQLPWTSMDETGWSIQSDTRDFSAATVEITANGQARPVTITVLGAGYGSNSAISMIPQGWTMTIGESYHVRIDGAGATIEYDVDIVEC